MKRKVYYQNGGKESKKRVISNMPPKKKKMTFLIDHLKSLNYWRDQLLALEKSYYSKDPEKERTCRNMINQYLDDVLDYNKNFKEKPKNKV